MVVGALGVVFGDIGTSPLYAMRESFAHHEATPERVYGILSLIVWALILVISLKYVYLMLKADHHGEGGILALVSRVSQTEASKSSWFPVVMALGIFGTSLLYGDGMITPAISVLSAVEGLEVVAPSLKSYVLPITVAILTLLFLFQSQGTERVGKIFGPITLTWFVVLAIMGVSHIVQEPRVLYALSPHYAIQFFLHEGVPGFLVLGSIFLVATGGEAMYADMGHFGRRPIQVAWFGLVFPCLLLNYFGQGALLLHDKSAADNPFFKMTPAGMRIYIVLLATVSTVVASQALITGAYSLTMQAIRASYLPRLQVHHTSARERGQIYVPSINWILMVCCILLVLGFKNSSNLAAAYGLGVNLDMLIATTMFFVLVIYGWNWPIWKAVLVCGTLLSFELAFLVANFAKLIKGGWFALTVGGLVFTLMTTWKNGRRIVGEILQARSVPMSQLLARLEKDPVARVPGTAVFMYGNPRGVPPALLSNLRHNKVLHQRVILVAVEIADTAYLPQSAKAKVTTIQPSIYRVQLRFGYMDRLIVPDLLRGLEIEGEPLKLEDCTFFLGKETVIPREDGRPGLAHWQEFLFAFLVRNATDATRFFQLPPEQVVELGTQLEI